MSCIFMAIFLTKKNLPRKISARNEQGWCWVLGYGYTQVSLSLGLHIFLSLMLLRGGEDFTHNLQ